MSGTYKLNGTEFTLQPTIGSWLPREPLGIDGNGHAIYPNVYDFEINWQLSSQAEFYQILGFFDTLNITGSVVMDLPKLRSSTYEFYSYTGCVIYEPTFGRYFVEYPENVKLLITNIRA